MYQFSCNDYTWNGVTYTTSGTYTWTGTDVNGCDRNKHSLVLRLVHVILYMEQHISIHVNSVIDSTATLVLTINSPILLQQL